MLTLNYKLSGPYEPNRSDLMVFEVDAASESQAYGQIPYKYGASHPIDRYLWADVPSLKKLSPGAGQPGRTSFWRIEVRFKPGNPPNGGQQDPLKQPPKLRFQIQLQGEPTARDVHGNRFVNTANDLLPAPNLDHPSLFLTVTRNEKEYDLGKAMRFSNKVNDTDFKLLNRFPIEKGQCRCHGINPAAEFQLGDKYVPVEYVFEFRPQGFKLRVCSQGRRGWHTVKGKKVVGHFQTAKGVDVTEDILLAKDGTPLDASFTVEGHNASARTTKLPKEITLDVAKDGSVFLLYDAFESENLSGIFN